MSIGRKCVKCVLQKSNDFIMHFFAFFQDVSASVSAGEEPYSKKRRSSYSHSPNPYGDYVDSKPGTPMSVNSEMSAASKLKLKIKVC